MTMTAKQQKAIIEKTIKANDSNSLGHLSKMGDKTFITDGYAMLYGPGLENIIGHPAKEVTSPNIDEFLKILDTRTGVREIEIEAVAGIKESFGIWCGRAENGEVTTLNIGGRFKMHNGHAPVITLSDVYIRLANALGISKFSVGAATEPIHGVNESTGIEFVMMPIRAAKEGE